jgi:hypothetical protein
VQHAQDLPFGRIKPNGSSCHPSWSRNNFKCETEDHHTSSYSLNCPPPKTKGCSWPICICYMGCLVIPLPLLLSSSFNLFPFKCKTEDQHTSSCSLDCLPPKTKGCSWPICIRYAGTKTWPIPQPHDSAGALPGIGSTASILNGNHQKTSINGCENEQWAHGIELRSYPNQGIMCKPSQNVLFSGSRLFVCAHQGTGGTKKYERKTNREIKESKRIKGGCPCHVRIKVYPHTRTVLGKYTPEHSHPTGKDNLKYVRIRVPTLEQIAGLIRLGLTDKEIVCDIYISSHN